MVSWHPRQARRPQRPRMTGSTNRGEYAHLPIRVLTVMAATIASQLCARSAGRGAVQRLQQTGANPSQVTAVLLTHLHSEHTVGLPELWLGSWWRCRRTPLEVYGPEGTKAVDHGPVRAYGYRIDAGGRSDQGRRDRAESFRSGQCRHPREPGGRRGGPGGLGRPVQGAVPGLRGCPQGPEAAWQAIAWRSSGPPPRIVLYKERPTLLPRWTIVRSSVGQQVRAIQRARAFLPWRTEPFLEEL
jgi:hypothetical protein